MVTTETDAAYLAGFFDGEGTISFGFGGWVKKEVTYWCPRIQVAICNTNNDCMKLLHKKTPLGHIYITPNNQPRKGRDTTKWHEITTWRMTSPKDIEQFLKIIEPYVILKKPYVTLCHDALNIITMSPSESRNIAYRQIIERAQKMRTQASRGRKRLLERPPLFQ